MELRQKTSAQTANRVLRTMKACLYFAMKELDALERNVLARFGKFESTEGERHASRDSFTEEEVRALLASAREGHERCLVATLAFTGMRPGELFALDGSSVDLEGGKLAVTRSWDNRGRKFVGPKTKAGIRVVPLSSWLVAELTAYKASTGGAGLVFGNGAGKPTNPSNFRRDTWLPLRKRAGVRPLDAYSLRHTFASLGRVSGESAFNVSRALGHAHSSIVDAVYAHSLPSGLASVGEAVTARALGMKPKLTVIEGGVREPLEKAPDSSSKVSATG